jgi:hypothetical protein
LGKSASVGRFASVVILVADPGKAGTELTPSATGTPERQDKGADQELPKTAKRGSKDFSAALIAKREELRFLFFAAALAFTGLALP